MPEGPWLYPADQTADLPARLLAAEITREKVYLRVHEELPYAASVETTAFEERKDGSARHRADHLRRARQPARHPDRQGRPDAEVDRRGLAQGAGRDPRPHRCTSSCTVKVKENWAEDRETYRDLGLDFDV